MEGLPNRITIVEVERLKGSIVVTFSNGHTVAYHAQFLFDVRNDDGNVELEWPTEEAS